MSNTTMLNPTSSVLEKNLRWHILNRRNGKYVYKAVLPMESSKYWNSAIYSIYDNLNKTFVN